MSWLQARSVNFMKKWRRIRDSNSWGDCSPAPFPRVCTRPLCESSWASVWRFYRERVFLQIIEKNFTFSWFCLYFYGIIGLSGNISTMYSFIETFFQNLGIHLESVTTREDGEDLYVEVKTPDSNLLIGMHGKNLEAIQHLLGRMAEKVRGKFIHLHLEVNDYMKAKDARLFSFLDTKIAFAMTTWKPLSLPDLSSFERKKAHGYIAERHIENLSSKSEGEGESRVLVLTYTWVLTSKPVIKKESPTPSTLDSLSEDGVGI